jgi:hypothetical protein
MDTLHEGPNAFFESMSLCLITPMVKAHWGYYGSKAIAIPFIRFTAVNDITKDDTKVPHFV